jgi:hypothetical protein
VIDVRVEGINAALRILDALPDDTALAREISEAVADEAVLPRLREYPPASGKSQPFISAKSRRYFFAALRRGQISVPRRRSNALRNSWRKYPFGGGVGVESSAAHAELVVGEGDKQAGYHKGNWWTVDSVAADVEREEAQPIAERVAQEFIRRSGG